MVEMLSIMGSTTSLLDLVLSLIYKEASWEMYNMGPPLSPVRGRDMKTTQKDREILAICAALGYKGLDTRYKPLVWFCLGRTGSFIILMVFFHCLPSSFAIHS